MIQDRWNWNLPAILTACLLLSACAAVEPASEPAELPTESTLEAVPDSAPAQEVAEPPVLGQPEADPGPRQEGEAGSQAPAAVEGEGASAGPVEERDRALDLERAVRLALDWYPSLDVAAGRVSQQSEEVNVARAGYYPQVTGSVDTGFERGGRDGWEPRLSINASQMLYDFGKVSSSVEAETAATDVTRAQLLLDVDSLVRDTATAVIEVQRNQSLLELAQAQIAGVQAIASLVGERTGRGASTRSDALQAEARVQTAESTLLEVGAQHERWESTLANFIGREPERVAPATPEWLLTACEIEEPEWSRVPALMEAEARRREALARFERSEAELMPTLSLETSAGYDIHQSSLSDRDRSRNQPEFMVGVRVSTNLYDGGANQARRSAASHALRTAEASSRQSRLEVTRSLMEARAQVRSLIELIASLEARDRMMRQTRDLYRQQYLQLGTRTLLDLLNAEQELHQARFTRANTIHDLRRLAVQCMFSSGTTRSHFGLEGTALRGMILEP